ncbi:MAG TPA: hypothetical protein VIF62_17130 [Labilithrix sp.]
MVATIGAAAAVSCAPDDRAFTIDPVFTETQRSTIASAGAKWNELLDETISFDGGSWRITRGAVPEGYAAWTDADQRLVTIAPHVSDDDLYRIVVHELGHSVGFVHHAEPGVMNPEPGPEFTDADRAECATVRRCR